MTRKKRDLPEGDDGRTIAEMNVEGMPWYTPGGQAARAGRNRKSPNDEPMTAKESRYYTWGALKAALLVTGVMCAGIVLFILFCLYIWF